MLPTIPSLREQIKIVIKDKGQQGRVIAGLPAELDALPDSYDALLAFARRLTG